MKAGASVVLRMVEVRKCPRRGREGQIALKTKLPTSGVFALQWNGVPE